MWASDLYQHSFQPLKGTMSTPVKMFLFSEVDRVPLYVILINTPKQKVISDF